MPEPAHHAPVQSGAEANAFGPSACLRLRADAMFTKDFFRWFIFAGGLGALWVIVLVVQIARKTDPVYDRLAGTAVLKHSGVPPALP
jgi:hypothetical protein